jgi:multidrug resistance efflux pump
MVFRVPADGGRPELEAAWPDRQPEVSELCARVLGVGAACKTLLEDASGDNAAPGVARIYHPLRGGVRPGQSFVIVLEMSGHDQADRRAAINLLHWNCEWLEYLLAHIPDGSAGPAPELFTIVAACLDQDTFRGTAITLVSELARHLGCQRVSFGLLKRRHIEVQVLSHSSGFKHQANLIQAIGAAMDEAVDQDRIITFSARDSNLATIVTLAHRELAGQLAHGTVCTTPVTVRGRVVGALTLERESGAPFDGADLQLIERLLAVVAPVLLLRYRDEQGLPAKGWRSLGGLARRLFGPAHIKLKLAIVTSVVALLLLGLVQGEWRVTAEAVVEGSVQRTIAAPIDGYIASATARAGDVVKTGQAMGSLDDGDLGLQRLKWSTLRQQMVSESREAMAQHDRAQVSIINARIEQADAELKLLDEQLSRTRLVSPFDGIVIEGDLSQQLGTPVSRGDILFRVAPLDDYRIVLKVDERDIAPVRVGQLGRLVLASMPARRLELRVDKITSVSTAAQGRNFFRVEASLTEPGPSLRPGMEGVGKLAVGEASVFWIWTHDLIDWLRLQAWTWWR